MSHSTQTLPTAYKFAPHTFSMGHKTSPLQADWPQGAQLLPKTQTCPTAQGLAPKNTDSPHSLKTYPMAHRLNLQPRHSPQPSDKLTPHHRDAVVYLTAHISPRGAQELGHNTQARPTVHPFTSQQMQLPHDTTTCLVVHSLAPPHLDLHQEDVLYTMRPVAQCPQNMPPVP